MCDEIRRGATINVSSLAQALPILAGAIWVLVCYAISSLGNFWYAISLDNRDLRLT